VKFVQLDDDFIRHAGVSRGGPDGGGESDFAGGGNIAGLDDGVIHRAEKAVADGLRRHGEVHVEKLGAALVDALAEVGVGLVGGAELDGVGEREGAIERLAGGGAGDDANLKGQALGMNLLGALANGQGDVLGRAGGGEAAERHGLSVLNQFRRLGGLQFGIGIHNND